MPRQPITKQLKQQQQQQQLKFIPQGCATTTTTTNTQHQLRLVALLLYRANLAGRQAQSARDVVPDARNHSANCICSPLEAAKNAQRHDNFLVTVAMNRLNTQN
jgi:hypothetical protein